MVVIDGERIVFKIYCKLFALHFVNEEKPIYGKVNYDALINKIRKIYKNYNEMAIQNEEIVLKNKINYEVKTEYYSFVIAFYSLVTGLTIECLREGKLDVFKLLYITLSVFLILFMSTMVYFSNDRSIKKSFYTMCLDILKQESGKSSN